MTTSTTRTADVMILRLLGKIAQWGDFRCTKHEFDLQGRAFARCVARNSCAKPVTGKLAPKLPSGQRGVVAFRRLIESIRPRPNARPNSRKPGQFHSPVILLGPQCHKRVKAPGQFTCISYRRNASADAERLCKVRMSAPGHPITPAGPPAPRTSSRHMPEKRRVPCRAERRQRTRGLACQSVTGRRRRRTSRS
jgi:hypothetical protein